jgi:hypothetical protein
LSGSSPSSTSISSPLSFLGLLHSSFSPTPHLPFLPSSPATHFPSLPLPLISLTSSPLISPPSSSLPVRASAQLYQSAEGYTGAAAEGDCGRRETHLECIRYRLLGRVFSAVSVADDCHSSSLHLLFPLDLSLPSYFPPLSPHLLLISVCALPLIIPVPSIAAPHRPFHTSSSSSCRNYSH